MHHSTPIVIATSNITSHHLRTIDSSGAHSTVLKLIMQHMTVTKTSQAKSVSAHHHRSMKKAVMHHSWSSRNQHQQQAVIHLKLCIHLRFSQQICT
jgi:hypothetical protein